MKVAPKFGFGTGQSDQQEASEPETKPDPESGAETEHTSESTADAEPEAETESTSEANFGESTEESPDTETNSTGDTESESEPETEPKTNLEALPAEEPVETSDNADEQAPEEDPETALEDAPEENNAEKPASVSETDSASITEVTLDATPEANADTTPETTSESATEAQSDSELEDATENEPELQPEGSIDEDPETYLENDAEIEPIAQPESVSDAISDNRPQASLESKLDDMQTTESESEPQTAEQEAIVTNPETASEDLPRQANVILQAVEHPVVSVIIPVYNVERYLNQALRSVQNQLLKELEIICVNDGSTDRSLAILQAHAEQDHRIKIIDKENGGYGSACNRGLAEAHGEWIAIVEPDDWIDPLMYRSMVDYAKSFGEPIDIVKTPYWRVWLPDTENERTINCSYRGRIKPNMQPFVLTDPGVTHLLIHHPSIWSALYNRDYLERNGIRFLEIPGAGWADNPFMAETLVRADSIVYLDEPFYHYREETPEKTESFGRNNWHVAIDRWHDMADVYDRLGVTEENIMTAHIRRGFTYLGQVLEYNDVDNPEIRERVRSVFDRMDDDLVFSEANVSPGAKELYAKVKEIDQPKVNPMPYAAQIVKGGLYNLANTGPAMTLDTLKAFVGSHAKREGKHK